MSDDSPNHKAGTSPNIVTIGSYLGKVQPSSLPALRAAALRRGDYEMIQRIDALQPPKQAK